MNALLVGCNYQESTTVPRLNGAIPSVLDMKNILINRFRFHRNDITVMTDYCSHPIKPTLKNMKEQFKRMIRNARSTSRLFFYFFGHGGFDKQQHPSGAPVSYMVTSDYFPFSTLDLMGIVDEVPFGATLTIVADCCYSGSLIYGPGFGDWAHKFVIPKNRPSTPVSTTQSMGSIERNGVTLEMLAQEIKAIHHIECDDIATLFLRVFGEDARLLFRSVPKDTSNLPQREKNLSSSSTKFYDYTIDPKEDSAILLSSCEGDEMAWEFLTPDGKFRGLFTYALLEVFKVHPHHISNKRLVDMAAEIVTTENPCQHPCLKCSYMNAEKIFWNQY